MSPHRPSPHTFGRYLLSKVEAAQRSVSGVTIFDPVLHMSSPSVDTSAASSADGLADSKPAAATAKLPDWEREGRLWSALKVNPRFLPRAVASCLRLLAIPARVASSCNDLRCLFVCLLAE